MVRLYTTLARNIVPFTLYPLPFTLVRVRQILKSLGEVAGKPKEAGEKRLKDIVLTNRRVKDIHDMLCHAAQVARERGVPLDKAYEYVCCCGCYCSYCSYCVGGPERVGLI